MITMLNIEEIIKTLRESPEQAAFDWKSDFTVPNDEEKKGEIIKDIAAIANASPLSYGFIFYGVDPRRADPIIGISARYDDAKLQQLVAEKIKPPVGFLYYEVTAGPRIVAVIQVKPTRQRPHIINIDLGKVRRGQIVIRRGSSTDGATIEDLFEFFYGETSGYFPNIIQRLNLDAQQKLAQVAYLRELREQADQARRDMEDTLGFRLR